MNLMLIDKTMCKVSNKDTRGMFEFVAQSLRTRFCSLSLNLDNIYNRPSIFVVNFEHVPSGWKKQLQR